MARENGTRENHFLAGNTDCFGVRTVIPFGKNNALIAHEKIDRKYTHVQAQQFAQELALHLAVNPGNISEAYEDIFIFSGPKENYQRMWIR